MLTNITAIVAAIYITEGGSKTKHPYGIISHYTNTTPRQACINTIIHAQLDYKYKVIKIDRAFIYFLADRYCPPSVDKTGNKNWKSNMVRILHINQ